LSYILRTRIAVYSKNENGILTVAKLIKKVVRCGEESS
jgi:hypothetical protein